MNRVDCKGRRRLSRACLLFERNSRNWFIFSPLNSDESLNNNDHASLDTRLRLKKIDILICYTTYWVTKSWIACSVDGKSGIYHIKWRYVILDNQWKMRHTVWSESWFKMKEICVAASWRLKRLFSAIAPKCNLKRTCKCCAGRPLVSVQSKLCLFRILRLQRNLDKTAVQSSRGRKYFY